MKEFIVEASSKLHSGNLACYCTLCPSVIGGGRSLKLFYGVELHNGKTSIRSRKRGFLTTEAIRPLTIRKSPYSLPHRSAWFMIIIPNWKVSMYLHRPETEEQSVL